jgi:hypothetical protein
MLVSFLVERPVRTDSSMVSMTSSRLSRIVRRSTWPLHRHACRATHSAVTITIHHVH